MTPDIRVMCEVPATVYIYTEHYVACLMLTHISLQTILRAICFISLSLTEKKQGMVGYQTKNELRKLRRIELNLI